MNTIRKSDYQAFVKEIKEKIRESQYKALKAVNRELISLNWEIGRAIVEKQEELGWGKSVVVTLSNDLQNEFPGTRGYSVQNLWYMRQFYLEYKANEKLQPLVGEISWSKNLVIMGKCKDDLQREFYIQMTKKYGWTKSVLVHQVESEAYERFLLNQTNFDFLELGQEYDERQLELGLINNVRSFLLEMGGDFSFIGNRYNLDVDGEEFFNDLLLYHRRLKSLVAIELKITDFIPEYAGKMQFYLSVLDDKVKQEDENPSIGIII
jgi:predicted nuclease of restriction endonuclease-like (RecB) superfamily